MSEPTRFTVTGDHSAYLLTGSTELDAVVTVCCRLGDEIEAEVAEVILIDRSGSMTDDKLTQAKHAAKTAVESLGEGVRFAVVAGDYDADPVYPANATLAEANPVTKAEAAAAIEGMEAGTTTNTGTWLRAAADILATRPAAIGHVLLLTDGRITQPLRTYESDLDYCADRFTCDSVAIGKDWEPAELERIGERFHGGFEYCEELANLAAHFTAITGHATARSVDDVELELYTPKGAEPGQLVQVRPGRQDLWTHKRQFGTRSGAWAFPLAPWGEESREYLLRVAFPSTGAGLSRAVRVAVTWKGRRVAQTEMRVKWTNERSQGLTVAPKVAEHLGLIEYGDHVRMFYESWQQGDVEAATEAIRQAREIVENGGHEQLESEVDRVSYRDPVTHEVQLRPEMGMPDALSVRTSSMRTSAMTQDWDDEEAEDAR